MFDIGPNLCNKQFDEDLEIVLNNASLNVNYLLLTSTDYFSFKKNIDIINKYSHILKMNTTYGLHPNRADDYLKFFSSFDKNISNPLIKAIGEFGLDYNRNFSSKKNQQITMEIFIEKCKNSKLPLFLHERDAFDDFYNFLKPHSFEGVVHCFTGNKNQLKHYLDLGYYIGITGWVTDKKRNQDLIDAIKYLPLDRMMIETDCPYLTPRNFNNPSRNEPKFLIYIVNYLSSILNIDKSTIINQTTKNSLDLFKF